MGASEWMKGRGKPPNALRAKWVEKEEEEEEEEVLIR
jgi:ribosomal protein L31E